MKKFVLLAAVACLSAATAWSQNFIPQTPGQYLKGQAMASFGQLMQGILALGNANRELDVEVVTARREFFEKVNTPQRDAAAARFTEALHKRDLHYVIYDIGRDPRGGQLLKLSMDVAGSRRVDDGLSRFSYHTYYAWSNEMIRNLNATQSKDKALELSMPVFEKYRVERDLVEALFFNPNSVLRAQNPNPQEYLAAWLLGVKKEKTAAAANAAAARVAAQVGKPRLAEIVAVLRDWTAVTDQLDGPWETSPLSGYEPLVTGKQNPPTPADWSGNGREFSQIRGMLMAPKVNLAASVDDLQQQWEVARQSRQLIDLYRAAERRDDLVNEIETTSLQNLQFRNDNYKTVRSMTELNFKFIDRGIQALEIDAMSRGEKNPRGVWAAAETKNYLAWRSKLIPRSVQAPPEKPEFKPSVMAAALASGSTYTSAPVAQAEPAPAPAGERRTTRRGAPGPAVTEAPVPAAPAARTTPVRTLPAAPADGAAPFDRAITMVQNLSALNIDLGTYSDLMHIHARNWELIYRHQADQSQRDYGMGNIIKETELMARDIRYKGNDQLDALKNNAQLRNNPEQRAAYEKRAAAFHEIATELDTRLVQMRLDVRKAPPEPMRF